MTRLSADSPSNVIHVIISFITEPTPAGAELEKRVSSDPESVSSSAGRSTSTRPGFVGMFQRLIDALPEQIALVDEEWIILAVNPAWTKTASVYGYEALRPGTDYAAFCRERASEGHSAARPVIDGIAELQAGTRQSFEYFYDGNDRWEGHTFHVRINQLSIDGRKLATITRYDISELMQLRRLREGFSQSVLETEAGERRRFARELHDSTQQLLVGISLTLGQLRQETSKEVLQAIEQMETLLSDVHAEIRAISYISHPPMLEKLGLRVALEELVAGFGRRARLSASFNVQGDVTPIWPAAETALYRTVQEALSNVHHHAHATSVDVRLLFRRSLVHAVIVDNGVGMPEATPVGVGLAGMRARLGELGGRLFVRHEPWGAALIASVPSKSEIRPSGDLTV
jgi:two-component system NarL family sensor kinase